MKTMLKLSTRLERKMKREKELKRTQKILEFELSKKLNMRIKKITIEILKKKFFRLNLRK